MEKIKNIYLSSNPNKRELIEQQFLPTVEERRLNGEVSSPVKLVDRMLISMPPEFWKSKNKVFEPCCGKGNFVLGIFDFFYKGLELLYPDEIDRCKFIMTECIYYADISPLNIFITTELLKCHIQSYTGEEELDYEFNSYMGDTLKFNIEDKWNIPLEQFAVIGNPPYNSNHTADTNFPIYNKFIEKYIPAHYLLFVVPSRWFIGGKGLDKFRLFMLKRRDIVFIRHVDNSAEFFGKIVNIQGGVNYFLKDSSYTGDCMFNNEPYNLSKYDCIIKPKYHKIVDFIKNMESITKMYNPSCFYKYESNDKRLKTSGKIRCYVSSYKSKDYIKYVDDFEFNEKNTFWKVITSRIHGHGGGIGKKFLLNPDEIYSGSFISFRVNNEEEGHSLLSYLNTNFVNYMVNIKKMTLDTCKKTLEYVPFVPLDRLWTDKSVLEYIDLKDY